MTRALAGDLSLDALGGARPLRCIWHANGVGVSTINQTISALRFFFKVTLKWHEIIEHTHVIHEPHKLPVVPSPEEMAQRLDAAPSARLQRSDATS